MKGCLASQGWNGRGNGSGSENVRGLWKMEGRKFPFALQKKAVAAVASRGLCGTC